MSTSQQRIEHRILAQHRVIAERLRANPEAVLAHARRNLARWAEQYAGEEHPAWMRDWEALLAGPTEVVLAVLIGEDEESIRLRSSSPFAGVLSARERWTILKEADDAAA